MSKNQFTRSHLAELVKRLREPRSWIHVVAGPRQVGKTTLVKQALKQLKMPYEYATADWPTVQLQGWIEKHWGAAQGLAREAGERGAILVLDEAQKVPGWSTTVKRLWDTDTWNDFPLKVVLLGSAPLLVGQGISESLTGRFEVLHLPHWSFSEMSEAFGWDLETYLYFGGYPGAAKLIKNEERWVRSIRNTIIETTITRDVLLLNRVLKPVLMRQLLELGCKKSSQIVSYTKLLGSLHDAGNTTTLAHYLELLSGAGMLTGLKKYKNEPILAKKGPPKLQVLNTALASALSGYSFEETRKIPEFWGRLTESAVGAHLANAVAQGDCEAYYWRDSDSHEVDFVARSGPRLLAIEVKSGRTPDHLPGLGAFVLAHNEARTLVVGGTGVPVEEFLRVPIRDWLQYGKQGRTFR